MHGLYRGIRGDIRGSFFLSDHCYLWTSSVVRWKSTLRNIVTGEQGPLKNSNRDFNCFLSALQGCYRWGIICRYHRWEENLEKWFLDLDSSSIASSVTDNLLNTWVILNSFYTLKQYLKLHEERENKSGEEGCGGERRRQILVSQACHSMFLEVHTEVLKVQGSSGLQLFHSLGSTLHFTSWSPCNERLSVTFHHCDTTVLTRLAHLNGMKPLKVWAQINLPLLHYFGEVLENMRSTNVDHWHWEGESSPWQNCSRGSQIPEMSLDMFLEQPARQSLECYK